MTVSRCLLALSDTFSFFSKSWDVEHTLAAFVPANQFGALLAKADSSDIVAAELAGLINAFRLGLKHERTSGFPGTTPLLHIGVPRYSLPLERSRRVRSSCACRSLMKRKNIQIAGFFADTC